MGNLLQSEMVKLISGYDVGCHELTWQGFPCYLVKAAWGELVISFQGAQVLWFRPADRNPVLWLSDCPKAPPAAIRGGIPVCWPWFADHPSDSSLPAHGYARTAEWRFTEQLISETGGRWMMEPESSLVEGVDLRLEIGVSEGELDLLLVTKNLGQELVAVTQALHSYFAVSGLSNVEVTGLEYTVYADKLEGMAQKPETSDAIVISAETDRIYQHQEDVSLIDNGWQRVIHISKSNSQSTVLWNPGAAAAKQSDIGLDQVDGFICVEAARTAFFDPVDVGPGETVALGTHIWVEEKF